MAIGLLIGAAVASKVVNKAYHAYKSSQFMAESLSESSSHGQPQIVTQNNSDNSFGDIRSVKAGLKGLEKYFHTDSDDGKPNNNQKTQNVNPDQFWIDDQSGFCEYCGCLIYLDGKVVSCPHCGAGIQGIKPRMVRRQQPPLPQQPQQAYYTAPPQVSGYYTQCYNCGVQVRYVVSNIIRSPGANRAVRAKGFTGHTGEVKCPRCGVFLPHYESNWR